MKLCFIFNTEKFNFSDIILLRLFQKNKTIMISYQIKGHSENSIVFLHGYLETMHVWNHFVEFFSEKYKIILIDLPGHGKSSFPEKEASMEVFADAIVDVLTTEKITQCMLIGHSMGGYAALAFAKKYPEFVKAFSLFHSHPFADTELVKKKRSKEIVLIKAGKLKLIANNNIPNTFSENNRKQFDKEITVIVENAKEMKPEGVIYALEAMKNRPDNSEFLRNTNIPFLYIWGKKDIFISNETFKHIEMPEHSEIVILEHSGHMAFIEEKEKARKVILEFAEKIFK